MDLFAPHPQLAHHLFYVPLEKGTVDVDANVKPPVRRSQRTKRSSREKRNQTHEFLSSMDMREESSIIEDEFPLFNPADGFGVEQTSAPPVHRVSPQRRTAIMEPQDIHKLSEEFLLQNTILLSVACIGAFVLFIVNFVGIFFCKDYLKRKEGQQVPLGVLGLYPQSLSHSRRCRYHTILRRFSLESGSHSQHESHSGVGSEPPMVGPLTLGPGGIEAGGQSVLNKTESRRHANAFAVLEVPEIIMMSERLGNGVHREEIRIVDNLHTGVGVPGPEPPASGVGGEEGGDGGGKGWRERLRIGRGKKDKELAVNASHLNGTGTLRGGINKHTGKYASTQISKTMDHTVANETFATTPRLTTSNTSVGKSVLSTLETTYGSIHTEDNTVSYDSSAATYSGSTFSLTESPLQSNETPIWIYAVLSIAAVLLLAIIALLICCCKSKCRNSSQPMRPFKRLERAITGKFGRPRPRSKNQYEDHSKGTIIADGGSSQDPVDIDLGERGPGDGTEHPTPPIISDLIDETKALKGTKESNGDAIGTTKPAAQKKRRKPQIKTNKAGVNGCKPKTAGHSDGVKAKPKRQRNAKTEGDPTYSNAKEKPSSLEDSEYYNAMEDFAKPSNSAPMKVKTKPNDVRSPGKVVVKKGWPNQKKLGAVESRAGPQRPAKQVKKPPKKEITAAPVNAVEEDQPGYYDFNDVEIEKPKQGKTATGANKEDEEDIDMIETEEFYSEMDQAGTVQEELYLDQDEVLEPNMLNTVIDHSADKNEQKGKGNVKYRKKLPNNQINAAQTNKPLAKKIHRSNGATEVADTKKQPARSGHKLRTKQNIRGQPQLASPARKVKKPQQNEIKSTAAKGGKTSNVAKLRYKYEEAATVETKSLKDDQPSYLGLHEGDSDSDDEEDYEKNFVSVPKDSDYKPRPPIRPDNRFAPL